MSYSREKFFRLVEDSYSNKQSRSDALNCFLSGDAETFVIGKNDESEKLLDLTDVDGLIDDFSENGEWNGVPVITTGDIPRDALVVNCSTSISPVTVGKKLEAMGVQNVVHISEIIDALDGKMERPWFVDQMYTDFVDHKDEWFQLYNMLADEESRNTLLDVMRFRLSANPEYMVDYSVRMDRQYFEPFMEIESEVFVDAGGFDGDTSEIFCTEYPDYQKVLLFEPSTKNMELAKKRLSEIRDIVYHKQGLSDEPGILSFDPSLGSASKVTQKSAHALTIEVTTLDKKIQEPVTFIKMDLEGWELKALKGSERHIIEEQPKLAIAVYHNASDFREIKNYILSLDVQYDIYLRHYTEGWSETVMYFVP